MDNKDYIKHIIENMCNTHSPSDIDSFYESFDNTDVPYIEDNGGVDGIVDSIRVAIMFCNIHNGYDLVCRPCIHCNDNNGKYYIAIEKCYMVTFLNKTSEFYTYHPVHIVSM